MTLKKIDEQGQMKTPYSKQEIVDIFEGKGSLEIPLRSEVIARKKPKVNKGKIPPRPKYIIAKKKKHVSQSYLNNLNPRIIKADKLWKSLWAHQRGELLRHIGVKDNDEIVELSNNKNVPEIVITTFIEGNLR